MTPTQIEDRIYTILFRHEEVTSRAAAELTDKIMEFIGDHLKEETSHERSKTT